MHQAFSFVALLDGRSPNTTKRAKELQLGHRCKRLRSLKGHLIKSSMNF